MYRVTALNVTQKGRICPAAHCQPTGQYYPYPAVTRYEEMMRTCLLELAGKCMTRAILLSESVEPLLVKGRGSG